MNCLPVGFRIGAECWTGASPGPGESRMLIQQFEWVVVAFLVGFALILPLVMVIIKKNERERVSRGVFV